MQDYAVSMSGSLSSTHHLDGLVKGRDRTYPHFLRKLYHAAMGLMCFSLYAFVLTRNQALYLLLAIGGPWIFLDVLRLRIPRLHAMALRVFGSVMRKEELSRPSGNSFFVIGLTVVVFIFSKPIALLSILFLALGDPTAAIVGTLWGKRKIPGSRKSVEGGLGNFAIAASATLLFSLFYLNLDLEHAILLSVLGGLVSMVAELIPLPFDDNFTIPVISATLLLVLSNFVSIS